MTICKLHVSVACILMCQFLSGQDLVETFNGPFPSHGGERARFETGFDYPGWAVVGLGEVEPLVPDGMSIQNTDSLVEIQRFFQTGDSFDITVRMRDFNFGDISNFDDASFASISMIYMMSPKTNGTPNTFYLSMINQGTNPDGRTYWAVNIGSSRERGRQFHVEQGTEIAISMGYDAANEEVCGSYDFDIDDDQDPLQLNRVPLDIVGNRLEQGLFLLTMVGAGDGHADALIESITMSPILERISGDLNNDGVIDLADINVWDTAFRNGLDEPIYDINTDERISHDDKSFLVHQLLHTYFGDSNLDGEFNSADLVNVFVAGEYEDAIEGNSTWATGDWSGNGEFDSADLVLAFQDGGYESGPREAVRSVPESNETGVAVLFGFLIGWLVRRRRFVA